MADDDLWYTMPTLAGHLVRLEPLTLEHAPDYLAAAGSPADAAEISRWQNPPGGALAQPTVVADARQHIAAALAARARGARLPYAQVDVVTGRFAGTTPFADPDPRLPRTAVVAPDLPRGGAPQSTAS